MSFPSPARDYTEESINLNKILIQHPHATFFMHAEGNSMINAFIPPKALLVIDRAVTVNNGDIVVAVVHGEYTARYLMKNDYTCWLIPANSKYPELKVTPEMEVTIWGVVIQIIINPKDLVRVLPTRCQ